MTEAQASAIESATPDLLDELVGIQPGSPLSEVRAQRADIARHIQTNYDGLLEPEDDSGVSRLERGLIALRVALLEESAPLIEHYRAYLTKLGAPAESVKAIEASSLGAPLSPRTIAILQHVDRLTKEPIVATSAHLAELKAHGLSAADIVTISQLIAFLSFQVRALVGLQLLAEGS
jgi:CMD domain protein